MDMVEIMEVFDRNLRKKLAELPGTQASILGKEGLDRGMLWALTRKDPRLGTLIRFARAVGVTSPEEFGELFRNLP